MSAVILPFPTRPVDIHEIATQLWELTMLGERDTDAYRTLERQFETRGGRLS